MVILPPYGGAGAYPHSIEEIQLGKPVTQRGLIAIGGIAEEDPARQPRRQGRFDLGKGYLTLGGKADLTRNLDRKSVV